MNRTFLTSMLAGSLLLGGCAHFTPGAAETTFDQVHLNATYYGAYNRPIHAVAENGSSPRRERPQREERERDEPVPAPAPQVAETAPPAPSPAPSTPSPAIDEPSEQASYTPSHAVAYVHDVYALNETAVTADGDELSIVNVYRYAQEDGTIYHSTRPAIGDLVFFHNTYDRNGDGRNNDWYTHIGLVESVADNGTIGVLSYVDNRVARITMNLDAPSDETVDGADANTTLRDRASNDPEYTQYLAGELFAGFGSLLGNRTEVVVIDNWQPDGSPELTAQR